MKKRHLIPRIIIFFAILLVAGSAHRLGLLRLLIHWIEGLGPMAPFVFLLVYIAAVIFCVPSLILTFAGGFIFNFGLASLLSVLGSALGSVGAFLLGRYLVRAAVEKRIVLIPDFDRIMAMVKKKGWKIVLLARFSPVFPFFIGNYAFGTTRMSARQYFFASLIGTIPSVMVFTYSGHLAGNLAGMGSHSRTPWEWGLLALGLAATIGVSFYLRRLALAEFRNK